MKKLITTKQILSNLRLCLLLATICVWTSAAYGTHIVNGAFDTDEWDAITPQTGIYSYFYCDVADSNLYIMNDWCNTDPGFELATNDTQWNTFLFTDANDDDWEFRVFADGDVTVWENTIEVTDSGIIAAYGFGPSLNVSNNHTLYEVMIPGNLIGPDFYPRIKEKDPRFPDDIGDGGWTDGGEDGFITPEPATICLLGLGALSLIRKKQ